MNTLDVYCFVWFCTGSKYEEICEITPYARNLSEYEFNEMCKLSIPTNSALEELKRFIKLMIDYNRVENAKYLVKYYLFDLGTQYNYEIINYSRASFSDLFLDELIEHGKSCVDVDVMRCILHVKSELIDIDDIEATFTKIIASKDEHEIFLYALVFSKYNPLYSNCLFTLSGRLGFDKGKTFSFPNITYKKVLYNYLECRKNYDVLREEYEKIKNQLIITNEVINTVIQKSEK